MLQVEYDTKKYLFKEFICEWFETNDLPNLHKIEQYDHFERSTDQSTIWHKKFYDNIRSDNAFIDKYYEFIENEIKPRYGEKIVFQKIPTFRVHLPGNIAVGEFHRDRDYRDAAWAKIVKETNYFLPLTRAFDTNTIWAESEDGKEDFMPLNCDYGAFYEWDASNLLHGNKDNISDNTRVSFDFRVIPQSRYIESNRQTINTDTEFKIGGYYDIL